MRHLSFRGAFGLCWAAALLLCLSFQPARALTLTDGVGTITVSDGDGSLTDFQAGGAPDVWSIVHYYRTTAMTAEASMIGELADPQITSVSQIGADTIRVLGSVAAFDYQMDYVLAGNTLTTNLTFTDTTGLDQNLALFVYQDWDLGAGQGLDDLLDWDGSEMTLSDPVLLDEVRIRAITAPIAAEAADFDLLLTDFLDASPSSLTDGAGLPFGPGDATFAFEYMLSVAANGQATLTTSYTLTPEPGSASLLGVGLAALAAWRRRAPRRA
jgi:hypothetical protein